MVSRDADPLQRLQHWYQSQCNGSWEHQQGIRIGTLDNPGWTLEIDLAETDLEDQHFDEIRFNLDSKSDWHVCWVRGHFFNGACGPLCLGKVVEVFLDWADRHAQRKLSETASRK